MKGHNTPVLCPVEQSYGRKETNNEADIEHRVFIHRYNRRYNAKRIPIEALVQYTIRHYLGECTAYRKWEIGRNGLWKC